MATESADGRYHAFISYSHAADGQLAPKLQSALQGFAKPWYRLRAIRVFRDTTSLSATPSLWPSIEAALRDSTFLLLMASPDAAKSRWVIRELETFIGAAGSKRILIVLTDGELRWARSRGDFDWRSTTAFPRLTQRVFEQEPLWVDVRALRSSEDLSLRNPEFRDAVARLSSAVRGIPTDQLIGEDIRHHRKAMQLAWSALVSFAVLAVGLALTGYYAYRRGIEALDAASRTRSEFMVSSAITLENDDPLTSALVLSSLDDSYRSDRALAVLRRVSNELPVAVLSGVDPKLSADGSRLLTFPTDAKTVLLWRTDTLEQPLVLTAHGGSIVDAAIDDRGRRVAVASSDKTVTIWDVAGPRQIAVVDGYAPTYSVLSRDSIAINGDGTRVAFLEGRRAVMVSIEGRDNPIGLEGHADATLSITFSQDGRHVATTSLDRTTRIWDMGGVLTDVLRVASSHPVHVQFSGDGHRVLTLDDNGTVRLWRPGSGEPPTMFNQAEYTPYWASLSSDGGRLVAGTKEGATLVWDVSSPQKRWVLPGPAWVRTVSFTPDGTRIITASDDGKARVWRPETDRPRVIKAHRGLVDSAVYDATHRRLFTSGADWYTRVWNLDGDEGEAVVLRGTDEQAANSVDFSPDGKQVVAGFKNGAVRVWNTTTPKRPLVLRGFSADVSAVAFSHRGAHILGLSRDGTARVWQADGRGDSVLLRDQAGFISHAAFSEDGTRILTTAGGVARIWSIDGQPGGVLFGGSGNSVAKAEFSPDGTRVVVVARNATVVCSADGRRAPVELWKAGEHESDEVTGARFSPDGSLVVGVAGKSARIWRADGSGQPIDLTIETTASDARFSPDGKSVLVLGFVSGAYLFRIDGRGAPLTLRPDEGYLRAGTFSPDGKLVALSTQLNTVIVWETDGPSTPLTLAGHTDMIEGVAFSPSQPLIGTAAKDGTVRLWRIDWQGLSSFVRARVVRSGVCLSEDERIQYLGEEAAQALARYQACESRFEVRSGL